MIANAPVDSIEDLIALSAPAKVYVGADIEKHCWPMAKRFLEIWRGLCDGKVAPSRADLSPLKISEVLPVISIFDVTHDPFLMKCRLMGSAFADAIGYDATGHYADDYTKTEMLVRRAKWVSAKVQPMLIVALPLVWSPDRSYKNYDTLSLPFLGVKDQVDTILYLNQFHAAKK